MNIRKRMFDYSVRTFTFYPDAWNIQYLYIPEFRIDQTSRVYSIGFVICIYIPEMSIEKSTRVV